MSFRLPLLLILLISGNLQAKISNESELSLIQSGGNSVAETNNLKTETKLVKEKRTYSIGGHYTLSSSEVEDTNGDKERVESARNWDINTKYEQELTKNFSGVFGIKVEGDEFSGIKQRENADLGVKYFTHKDDKINSYFQLGLRYTVEKTTARNEDNEDVFNYTKGNVYYEITHKMSESLSYKFWFEYLPNLTESEDYQITYEPSLIFVLSNTFSLKTGYKGIYDNQPNVEGNEYTDFTFTTSILAKF
jgi:hypothetical protein